MSCDLAVLLPLLATVLVGPGCGAPDSNAAQVLAAPGAPTSLRCDLAAPARDVAMLLWFKDSDRMPIYTVDFRNGAPVHWATAGEFGARTHFVLNESDPGGARLAVSGVGRGDAGLYRCRVDYVNAPTRNYRVNLTVVVPPEAPRLYDSEGREILGGRAGPFREGQDVLLSCQALGGVPPPAVSWHRGDAELARAAAGPVCQLPLPRLPRAMDGAKLLCRVSAPLLEPVTRSVTVKMFLKPQWVRVSGGGGGAARAGSTRGFECSTRGSKPAPNVDWFIDAQPVDSKLTQTEVDGDATRSVLTWRARRRDAGRTLLCRVSNPWFPAHTLEDSLVMEVLYPPVARLTLESPTEPRGLREDETAVLRCSADAAPPATNFTFYKEGHVVHDDPVGGVSVEAGRLVLRRLRRHHAARYRCAAANAEGAATSDALTLDVLSRPECSAGGVTQQLAAAPGGLVRARCAVSAPAAAAAGPLRFFWTYNGTRDVLPIPASNVTVSGASSTAVHGLAPAAAVGAAAVEEELGWLACWAANDVGNQREPCLFRIVPAGLPEPPLHCELVSGLTLQCEPGHDGGLPQRFLLEVLEVRPEPPGRAPPPEEPPSTDNEISTMNDQGVSGRGLSEAVYRASNDAPHFALDALTPGRYTFLVYSETSRGRSPRPAALHAVPIRTADDLDRPGSLHTMPSPAPPAPADQGVALLTGAVLSLVLVTLLTTLCVALVVMCRKKRRPPEQSLITRRSVGVSMYSGSVVGAAPAAVVVARGHRGHRGSRVLAARWSGVVDDTPLAVLALDAGAHDVDLGALDYHQETALTRTVDHMETQTDS